MKQNIYFKQLCISLLLKNDYIRLLTNEVKLGKQSNKFDREFKNQGKGENKPEDITI